LQRTNFLRFVLTLSPGEDSLGAKIDELHEAGWKTVKTGIGRSKVFVETFLRRRLEAVLVPEPSKGDAPRKAKVAKDWKDAKEVVAGATLPTALSLPSFYSTLSSIIRAVTPPVGASSP
jgi:hypothetical protein